MGKSRRRGFSETRGNVKMGVAWYSEVEWVKLKTVAADPKTREKTHEAWCRAYEKGTRMLHHAGAEWERVPILADELIRWCTEQGRPLDSRARSEYAALKLQESEGTSSES